MKTAIALLLLAVPATSAGTAYNYCSSTPNSFGTAAVIGYTGSLAVTDGTFQLTVTGCPPNAASYGMFTCGQSQYNVPFGAGTLCIRPFNPGINRMPVQALAPGVISHDVLLDAGAAAMFQPGSSWNFQFWYRDPNAGGTCFNLSDGLHVDFAL
jgi:hypothetical protein